MGYRSDSIEVSRDMGPLSSREVRETMIEASLVGKRAAPGLMICRFLARLGWIEEGHITAAI